MNQRDRIAIIADDIEASHSYDIVRGKCSCGRFRSRDPRAVREHYLDALALYLTAKEISW